MARLGVGKRVLTLLALQQTVVPEQMFPPARRVVSTTGLRMEWQRVGSSLKTLQVV